MVSMINLAQTKVWCPNCLRLRLWGTGCEAEGELRRVQWFHQYGDYCEDLFDWNYYRQHQHTNYFRTLREVFGITICESSPSLLP